MYQIKFKIICLYLVKDIINSSAAFSKAGFKTIYISQKGIPFDAFKIFIFVTHYLRNLSISHILQLVREIFQGKSILSYHIPTIQIISHVHIYFKLKSINQSYPILKTIQFNISCPVLVPF